MKRRSDDYWDDENNNNHNQNQNQAGSTKSNRRTKAQKNNSSESSTESDQKDKQSDNQTTAKASKASINHQISTPTHHKQANSDESSKEAKGNTFKHQPRRPSDDSSNSHEQNKSKKKTDPNVTKNIPSVQQKKSLLSDSNDTEAKHQTLYEGQNKKETQKSGVEVAAQELTEQILLAARASLSSEEERPRTVRRILDDKYILLKTIGHGRYAKVKLAIDLMTSKQVAVKILKVREGDEVSFCKYEALDHFFTEIEILSQCDHPNVVKIKSSSFDGTIVKEAIRSVTSQQKYDSNESIRKVSADIHRLVGGSSEGNISDRDDRIVLKRQSKICYYVMKLAEYGEVYRIIELNDRLSENLVRNLFKQLLDGLSYLHQHGFVHRDVKPENLLIDRKYRLIIADFNFATRLQKVTKENKPSSSNQFVPVKGIDTENLCVQNQSLYAVKKQLRSCWYNPKVEAYTQVGSEAFNAPECWYKTDQYDGIKADMFSAAATLFMLTLKFQPFRRATLKDPYYKRLVTAKDKRQFWKIFSSFPTSSDFKDIFMQMTNPEPELRPGCDELLNQHQYFQKDCGLDYKDRKENQEKIKSGMATVCSSAYVLLENADLGQVPQADDLNSPYNSTQGQNGIDMSEDEQLEKVRQSLIEDVRQISLKLKHQQNIKKISKEAMKNMIAEPIAYMQGLKKVSMDANQRNGARNSCEEESNQANASQNQGPNNLKCTGNMTGLYHSDEENQRGSDNSSTLARYTRGSRRTSSCHNFNPDFNDEEDDQDDSLEEE